jgi:replicative DNA helicase
LPPTWSAYHCTSTIPPAQTIGGLRARARRLKRTHGLDLVVVDYLQLLDASNRKDGRVQEVSEITRGLKTLAKELDVPVLAFRS